MVADDLWQNIIIGIITFLYGIVIGSFLNVCILRIPVKESLSKERSHCMSCGYQLRWYDLVPLFSYLFLGGRCRKCGKHISVQYPIVEALNGVVYVLLFIFNGWSIDTIIYCLFLSSLIVFSVIDFRTYDIPYGMDIFMLALGLVHLGIHLGDWADFAISPPAVSRLFWYHLGSWTGNWQVCMKSFVAVAILSEIVYRIVGKKRIRYTHVRLVRMAAFLLEWELLVGALVVGCFLGSISEIVRKKTKNKSPDEGYGQTFAAFFSAGILIAILF